MARPAHRPAVANIEPEGRIQGERLDVIRFQHAAPLVARKASEVVTRKYGCAPLPVRCGSANHLVGSCSLVAERRVPGVTASVAAILCRLAAMLWNIERARARFAVQRDAILRMMRPA